MACSMMLAQRTVLLLPGERLDETRSRSDEACARPAGSLPEWQGRGRAAELFWESFEFCHDEQVSLYVPARLRARLLGAFGRA
jgi:hypothetical protein